MIIVISGKAGSGKTTLRTELLKSCDVKKAISFTTRSPKETVQKSKIFINSIPRKVLYNPRFLPSVFSQSNEMQ